MLTGDEVRILEGLSTPPAAGEYRGRHFDAIAFAPDGRSLAVVNGPRVCLVELSSGKERAVLGVLPAAPRWKEETPTATSTAFSPAGRILGVAGADGVIRLWDVVAGDELLPLIGHDGLVQALAFAGDGKTLFSYGEDNRVVTWSVADARRPWPARKEKPSERELTVLWGQFAGADRAARYEAVRLLAGSPAEVMPFLRERLRPVPAIDSQHTAQLVAELSKPDFNDRKRAAVELRKLGDLALPALRASENRSDDVVRRMWDRLQEQYPTPAQAQALRGLAVLERIGNEDARKLLGELAKGAAESELTRQAQRALDRLKQEGDATAADKLESLWTELAGDDARKAFRAVRALAARPKDAVPFLAERLRTVAAQKEFDDDPKRIARLISELDSDEFAVREAAAKELAKLGTLAEPALRKALSGSPGPELKRRAEGLLQQMSKPAPSPERLQADRALEALECVGNAEAGEALERLNKDGRNAWLRQAVTGTLGRMKR